MSVMEGITAKLDNLCDEICALREQFTTLSAQVATLEETLANVKAQPAAGTRSASQPPPATSKTTR